MGNIMDFLKEKSYYLLGGTVILIILLIVISACSAGGGSSYESIENKMVSAAKEYYSNREKLLPKKEDGSVKVTISTLVETELIKEIHDPKDKENICTGFVEVKKVGKDYSYLPFLKCKGNYEPEYLTDKIKKTKLDELNNGLHKINNDYVYRGDIVNNYVKFDNKDWRIVKIDSENKIHLILINNFELISTWDNRFNSSINDSYGINDDYLVSEIRRNLKKYYNEQISKNAKAITTTTDLNVGKYNPTDKFSEDLEKTNIIKNEKIGLISANDYHNASLDTNCIYIGSKECINRNYLSFDEYNTWILNASKETSYLVFSLAKNIISNIASNKIGFMPVIYLSDNAIVTDGDGSIDKPYIIKTVQE